MTAIPLLHLTGSSIFIALCGTIRGVPVGALAVIAVVHGTTLSQKVSDDIEARLCNFDSFTSDIGVEQLEIFIY